MTGSGNAPAPRPTLARVAARAGVSVSTASLVFSGAGPVAESTRERVRAAATELDYAGPDPTARSLRRGRSGVVAVITEDALAESFRDPMNLAFLDGVGEGFGDQPIGLLVIPLAAAPGASLPETAMDAAILLGCSTDVAVSIAALRRRRVPIIAIEAESVAGIRSIDLDDRAASRRGAEHLRDLGHARVAVVTLPAETARERGVLSAARLAAATAHGTRQRLAGARDVFPDAVAVSAAASTIAEGMRAAAILLDGPAASRPTAIVAQSDLLALGVIRAAEERGLAVPADLSVIGFDGIRLDGLLDRPLTTLVQPAVEKGRRAAAGALALLAGEEPADVVLTCELRIGATTGPAPRG